MGMFDNLFGQAGQDAGNLDFTSNFGGGGGEQFGPPMSAMNSGGPDWGSFFSNEAPADWTNSLPQQSMIDKLGGWGAVMPSAMKGLGTLFSMNETRQKQRALQDIADQQAFYNNKLQQSYNDPNSYLNSPEGRALRSGTAQAVARQAAATGRRSQTGAQMNLVNQAMMDNLGKYRAGLEKAYSPQNQLAAQLKANERSGKGDVLAGLESLFTSPLGQKVLGMAMPALGGVLGGIGGLAGNALGGLSGLFGGSTPDLSFANPGAGFMSLPSIDEWM